MTTVRVGSGLDVHPFADDPDRVLVLCGVEVAGATGLAGHSDGDVAAHAVADALLGAAALGDLGSRFGTDRPEWEGASSLRLLAEVVHDVTADGWRVTNLDVTVVAQGPRLGEHRDAMRARLADTCHLDVASVSVKFTTTDGLGSIGRGEGIGAWCCGLLVAADG